MTVDGNNESRSATGTSSRRNSGQGLLDLEDIELALTAISRLQLNSAPFPVNLETLQNLNRNLPKVSKLVSKFARSYAKNGLDRLANQLS